MKSTLSRSAWILVAALSLGSPATAQLDGTADSSTFAYQYDGAAIWDGTAFLNQWGQAGGHTPAALGLSGTDLVFSPDANNGWVQHDADNTPWESASGKWTVEINLKLNDLDETIEDGIVIWGERDGNRGVLWIQDDAVTDINGTPIATGLDNTDGFHTFRIAFDPTDTTASPGGTHHIWRNNELLSGAGVDINLAGGNQSRLIIGDCCTNIGNPVDQYEIGYIRYQPDMALAAVPEPNTFVLAAVSSLALLGVRRRK